MLCCALDSQKSTEPSRSTDIVDHKYNTGNQEADDELETLWQAEDAGFLAAGTTEKAYREYIRKKS